MSGVMPGTVNMEPGVPQQMSQTRRTGWLILLPLGIWLLATPYGHVQDVAAVFPLAILARTCAPPGGWVEGR